MFRTRDANGNVKYIARSKAVVVDNRDPLNRGRIIVDHPLLGNTVWIDYIREPGIFSVPSIGDVVYVECDSGTHEFPVASGIVTKGEDSNPQLPSKFKRDIPTNRGFFTPGGHSIELDDGVATITDNPDDAQFTTDSRGIRITTSGGNRLHFDDKDNVVILESKDTAQIIAPTQVTVDSAKTVVTGEEEVQGDLNAKANAKVDGNATVDGNTQVGGNLQVTGNSQLGGGTPLVLATAQFIGTGNLGAPVISTIMSGQATKVTGS